MTREIITEVSAEIRITLPDGEVVTTSTDGGSTAEVTEVAEVPTLPEIDADDGTGPNLRPGEATGSGPNSAVAGDDALAELPPELLDVETMGPSGAGNLPPPSVAQLEAMVAAAEASANDLPPEVVALEALIDADSASLEPPDITELKPPKRTSRKRK